nr:hypothetical protein [Tanacetum cinerariifolium]
MAAGSRDRPPMLATGRYAQWQPRFLRYIDTIPNGDALRKCILEGPYQPTTVTIRVVPATADSPAVPERTTEGLGKVVGIMWSSGGVVRSGGDGGLKVGGKSG